MVNRQDLQTLEDQITIKYEAQIKLLENTFNAKVDALQQVIDRKDKELGLLNQIVGKLEAKLETVCNKQNDMGKSLDFITEETTTLRGLINKNTMVTDAVQKHANRIDDKTADLEDRSRRHNLVFFNFPEIETNDREDCEKLVANELVARGIFQSTDIIYMDRAHRLGPRKTNQNRPRPVIVKMTYYKDKAYIIQSGRKFAESAVNVAEDYSKKTLEIHKILTNAAKTAKESLPSIKQFRITYRRVVLKYENPTSHSFFFKGFNLYDINKGPDWFKA